MLLRLILVWGLVALFFSAGLWYAVVLPDGGYWIVVAWSGNAIVGAILLTHRARSWVGAFLLAFALYWAVTGILYVPGVAVVTPVWLEVAVAASGVAIWSLVPLLVLVYPDDRIETRLGRGVAVATCVLVGLVTIAQVISPTPLQFTDRVSPWAVQALAPITNVIISGPSLLVLPLLLAAAMVDLVRRWRRSSGARRLQFRWISYGAAVTAVLLIIASVSPELPDAVALPLVAGFNAIPVTVFIAVSRHGLYEVDRVISRTLSYAIVTAIVVTVYAALATSMTWLLPAAPSIAIAAATLTAAALFLPVLHRVQRTIDRRFDRERYDAAKTVDAFGRRLRLAVDPVATGADLLDVVERSLQPTSVGLWTRGAAR